MKREGSFSPPHPSKKPSSAPITTMETNDNKLSNLVAEMEKAKEEILASRTYHNLLTQLETNPAIKSNIDRILCSHDRMPMVLYGIDSIRDSPTSKYRLALALLLKDHPVLRAEVIQVRHPNLSPLERDAMTALGCAIVCIKEHCRKIRFESERPALYLMSSTRQGLLGDLLEENWRPSRLNRLAILGHSFAKIVNDMAKEISIKEGHPMVEDLCSHETERLRYVCAVAWFTLEFDILDVSDKIQSSGSEADEHLEDLGWHFFQPAQEIDMNAFLPRLPESIERKDWIDFVSGMDEDEFDEASRLTEEIEVTIKELKESQFYQSFLEKLEKDPTLRIEFSRRFNFGKHGQMVVYALGSLQHYHFSQFQFALALLLKWELDILNILEIQVFDPVFTWADIVVMQSFGCTVLRVNENCGRTVDQPTLLFMPCCYSFLTGNLIKENWEPEQLHKIVMLSGALFNEVEDISNWKEGNAWYVWAIRDHITTYPFTAFPVFDSEPFGKYQWMFFNIDSEMELEGLLSGFKEIEDIKEADIYISSWSPADSIRDLSEFGEQDFAKPFASDIEDIRFAYVIREENRDWTDIFRQIRLPRRILGAWRPPHAGWIKLNFATVMDHKRAGWAGFAGLFHDEEGALLLSYAGPVEEDGSSSLVAAQLEGLKQGLQWFKLMSRAKKLVIESDALSLVRWINGTIPPPQCHTAGFAEINHLLSSFEWVAYHIYEEANARAIELATKGTRLSKLCVWSEKKSVGDDTYPCGFSRSNKKWESAAQLAREEFEEEETEDEETEEEETEDEETEDEETKEEEPKDE